MAIPVHDVLQNFFKSQANWKIKLLASFADIVGAGLKDHLSILHISTATITIGVSTSCLLQEMYTLRPILLNKINNTIDSCPITDIYLKLKGKSRNNMQSFRFQEESGKGTHVLTHEDRVPLKKLKDPELVQHLEAFRVRCYRESEWRKK